METKRKLSRRDFLKLSSVAAAGAALGACVAPTAAPGAPAAAPQAAAPAAAGPVTLEYWTCWPGIYQEKQRKILDVFEQQHTNIKVHDLTVPSNIRDKLLTAVAAGEAPDATACFGDVVSLAAKGGLMAIDEYVKGATLLKLDELYKPRVQATYWRSKEYGLPYNCSAEIMILNRTLFEAAGVDPEKQIDNWQDFTEISKKLVKFDDAGNLKVAAYTNWYPRHPSLWFWINDSDAYDAQNEKITIDQPANVEGLQTIIDYAWNVYGDVTKADTFISGQGSAAESPFCTNTQAVVYDGDWAPSTYHEWCKDVKMYPMLFPKGPKGKAPVASGAGDFQAIPKGAKHPAEAFTFIEWMVMKGNRMWTEAGVDTCCTVKDAGIVRSDWPDIFGDKAAEISKWWAEAAALTRPVENFPAYGFMVTELARVFDLALHKQTTAAEALAEAQKTVQEEMDKYTVP